MKVLTARMARLAGVDAPLNGRFVLEDRLGFERNPIAANRSVARVVFDRNGRRKLLKLFDEGAVGLDQELRQLFCVKVVSTECPLGRRNIPPQVIYGPNGGSNRHTFSVIT